MSTDTWGGQKLDLNDTITYRKAEIAAQNPHAPPQRLGMSPYTGVIVAFTSSKIGVRADGFQGKSPLYYVLPEDILSVKTWREEIW